MGVEGLVVRLESKEVEGEEKEQQNTPAAPTHHVGIVPGLRFILHVGSVDGDATGLLLRGLVNVLVRHLFCATRLRQNRGNGCRQCGLAMVHVTA